MSFLFQRTNQLEKLLKKTEFSNGSESLDSKEIFEEIYALFKSLKENQQKVFVIGNGGSAGIASHHVVDLVNVLELSALTLSDNNLITCMGNDYGYSSIYARPLNVLANEGDLLIAISSSGASENILQACRIMQDKKNKVITLSGFEPNNPLRSLGDYNIWTGSKDYGLVESAHFFILHTLVDGWASWSSFQEMLVTSY